MEREVALRKLDCHRGQMEAALKTAVETLASVRTHARQKPTFSHLEVQVQQSDR
jgi:hypothetical protein